MKKLSLIIVLILFFIANANAEVITDQKCNPNSNICIRVGYIGHNSAWAIIDRSEDKGTTWERVGECFSPAQGPIIACYLLKLEFSNLGWHATGRSWVGNFEDNHIAEMWADSSADGRNWYCQYGT